MHPPIALRTALAVLPATEYRKTLYRAVRPLFLTPTPLSGIGARLHGARYTPKNSFDTIYLAEDPLTAFIEFHNEVLSTRRDADDEDLFRLTTVAPQALFEIGGLLDLTQRGTRQHLGTTLNELAQPWRMFTGLPPTQYLAQEAFATKRYLGIRFFSVRNPGGICLAIFEDLLRAKGGPDFLDLDDPANGGPQQHIP